MNFYKSPKQQFRSIPFICPGGIISQAVIAAAGKPASYWRDVYQDADKLYQLAVATQKLGKMDNYAVPLCLTVEAELFGAQVDYSASFCELKVRDYPFRSLEQLLKHEIKDTRRRELVLDVIRRLRAVAGDGAIFGAVTGPVTLLTQLVDPGIIFRAMHRRQELVHKALQRLLDTIDEYGQRQIEAGVDAIIIGEPIANGEILGASSFAKFSAPYLTQLLKSFQRHLSGNIILHICGRIDNLIDELKKLSFSMLSVDSASDIKYLRGALGDKIIIGSVCTHNLARQTPAQIKAISKEIINQGADALSLPCGLNPATPHKNLQAMHEAAQNSKPEGK